MISFNSYHNSGVVLINWVIFVLTAFIILWGSLINFKGLKYSRVNDQYRTTEDQYRTCNHLLLELTTPDSQVCCDGRAEDWVCRASYDEQGRLFTSGWAWIIPMSLPLTTMLCEALSLLFQQSVTNSTSNKKSTLSHGGFAFLSPIKPLIQLFETTYLGRYAIILIRTLIRSMIYFIITIIRAVSRILIN